MFRVRPSISAYWSNPLGGCGGVEHVQVRGNAAAHFGYATHTLSDILSPLNIILAVVASGIGSVSYWEGQNTHTQIHHTHPHSHRFQISLSAFRDCFTGNHVTGQMIELLMEVRRITIFPCLL